MTRETKIRTKSIADDTNLRCLEVSIGKSKLLTPSKSLGADFVSNTKLPNNLSSQFNEISKSFKPDTIEKIRQNPEASRKKNNEFKKMYNNGANLPTISFIDYKTTEPVFPTDDEINLLTNFAYTYSDITPIPAVPKCATNLSFETIDSFLDYLRRSIESIEVWNNKPIMGYLPFVGSLFLEEIIELYIDNGINAFYLDFNRKGFSDLTAITSIKKKLGQLGYAENHLIHFINMDYGKMNKEAQVLPARDFLGFAHGLDSMGDVHRTLGFAKKNIVKPTPATIEKFRVFNRDGYGYYRIDMGELEGMLVYPEEAMYSSKDILSERVMARKKNMLKLVNFQEQKKECDLLQVIANEDEKHSYDYFDSKKFIDKKDLKKIKR